MHDSRPVFLKLSQLRFPMTAIASILHRLSGVLLALALPFFLAVLDKSLISEAGYQAVVDCLTHPWCKLFIWIFLSALIFHLIAGVRHLLMDIGIGDSLSSGRLGAVLVMSLSALSIISLGIWLW